MKQFRYVEPLVGRMSPSSTKPESEAKDTPVYREMDPRFGAAVFGGVAVIGLGVGAAIGTYVFFGAVTLAGMVAVIETNPKLKRLAASSTRVIDVGLFVATIYAVSTLGITAAASLTVAGLGYSLIYGPYLRMQKES